MLEEFVILRAIHTVIRFFEECTDVHVENPFCLLVRTFIELLSQPPIMLFQFCLLSKHRWRASKYCFFPWQEKLKEQPKKSAANGAANAPTHPQYPTGGMVELTGTCTVLAHSIDDGQTCTNWNLSNSPWMRPSWTCLFNVFWCFKQISRIFGRAATARLECSHRQRMNLYWSGLHIQQASFLHCWLS